MYKILIVGEKWSACNPEFGFSAIHHNFIGSLSSTGLAEIKTFFYDAYVHDTHQRCDSALLEKCRQERPDFVILETGSRHRPKSKSGDTRRDPAANNCQGGINPQRYA